MSRAKKKTKRKNREMRIAAAVFGGGVIIAAVMFALSKTSEAPDEPDLAVMGTNSFAEEETYSETETQTSPPDEATNKKAYIVTADIRDIITGTESPVGENEDTTVITSENSGDEETTSAPTQTKTVITHRDRSAYNGSSVYVDMENISQQPELPVGCEITALAILLNFWGFDADKCDMARNYLPISSGRYKYEDGKTYKDSFFDFFIGDPFSRGYGCFSNAIEKAADSYINDNGGGYRVKNISGCSPDTLYGYLEDEIPVLVWATDGMIEPEYYETWYDIDTGEQLDWYLNEHCAVLAGFDMEKEVVTLNDPNKGIIDYNIDKFETRFAQMHSQALVILPDSDSPDEDDGGYDETEDYSEEMTEYILSEENDEELEIDDESETESETETESEYETESETEADTSYYDDEEYIDEDIFL